MRSIGDDAALRAREGDRLLPTVVYSHRHEGHRDPLAGREKHVQLAGMRISRYLPGQLEEVVGGVRHGGYDHDQLGAGAPRAHDVLGDVVDPLRRPDGCSAVLLDEQWHASRALLAEGAGYGTALRDPSRDRASTDGGAGERSNHGRPDASALPGSVHREKGGPTPADRHSVRSRAPARVDDPVEGRDQPRAARHMVHVPERFGHEIDASAREGVEKRERPRGVRGGVLQRDRLREHRARLRGAHTEVGDDQRHRDAARKGEPDRLDAPRLERHGEDEPPEEGGRHVVGMALEANRLAEEVGHREPASDPVVGEREAGDDGRGAGTQPARDRNARAHRERNGRDRRRGEAAEVAEGGEDRIAVGIEEEVAPLPAALDPEAVGDPACHRGQRQAYRKPEAIEPGTEVRGRGGHRYGPRVGPGPAHPRIVLRSTAGSASTVSTVGETWTARSGSLRPWPVTVATAVRTPESAPRAPSFNNPATPAADAGSTNTP